MVGKKYENTDYFVDYPLELHAAVDVAPFFRQVLSENGMSRSAMLTKIRMDNARKLSVRPPVDRVDRT